MTARPLPLGVGVLASGRGSNLQAILDEIACGRLDAAVRVVVSDIPDAFALERARLAGVPAVFVDPRDAGGKETFERRVADVLRGHGVELVVLAGYMRILSPAFIARFEGRLLNIHPSLLPMFPGLNTHERALEEGVKIHGCTVHFVTAQLDHGPIVIQAAVPVRADDTPATLSARVLAQEHRIYPQAIRWFAEGSLVNLHGRVNVQDDLTSQAVLAIEA